MKNAISPIDGRYSNKLNHLSRFFSENALIKYRVKVEILYFLELSKSGILKQKISPLKSKKLHTLIENFSENESSAIKKIELTTKHDVKAVEYFVKAQIDSIGLSKAREFVHFGLTSQDINNTAVPMLMRDATHLELIPLLENLLIRFQKIARQNRNVSMLARTHGQPASPTTLGKELFVYSERLKLQLQKLKSYKFSGKFGGATGNFNAHVIAYPKKNWASWANNFLKSKLQLERQQTTTQIAHYDEIAEWCHLLIRINTILIDFCRDIWTYISMEYFSQEIKAGEIGSSAMPHKVNPIDFENAEGNLSLANSTLSYLAEKLPVSRLQRDLTDSTVLRNIGVPFSHGYLAILSIISGLNKLTVNKAKIKSDLNEHWIVLSEAIQTILRREHVDGAYELLKDLTRTNSEITKSEVHNFIAKLPVSDKVKKELFKITPSNYIGLANKF